jgi:hypothetical protein
VFADPKRFEKYDACCKINGRDAFISAVYFYGRLSQQMCFYFLFFISVLLGWDGSQRAKQSVLLMVDSRGKEE